MNEKKRQEWPERVKSIRKQSQFGRQQMPVLVPYEDEPDIEYLVKSS